MILDVPQCEHADGCCVSFTARFTHTRFARQSTPTHVTLCELWGPVKGAAFPVLGQGVVRCDSRDRFEKAEGRKKALAKAMKMAEFSKADRRQLWTAYFNTVRDGPTKR